MEKLRLDSSRIEISDNPKERILDKTEEQTQNNPEKHLDRFEETNINLRKLARERRFGHIALTSSITGTNSITGANNTTGTITSTNNITSTNRNDNLYTNSSITQQRHKTALGREFLNTIASNALCMRNIVNSIDIIFLIKIASVIREEINTENFPYFIADLYILLLSWEKENFNPELINQHYNLWLESLWEKYE